MIKINEMEVLAIDSYANYNGVSKNVRKILWSEYVKSTDDNINYKGLPLIAKNQAYRVTNKSEKVDLTEKTGDKKATYDIYAQKMGESSVFPPFNFNDAPNPTWTDPMSTETINISGNINENKFYNGNVLVNESLTIDEGVSISIRGNLKINANVKLNSSSTDKDINFYVYNEGNQETALEINPPQSGEVNANFYVKQGKINIDLKKATLYGDIVSNDSFKGSLTEEGYPNQNDYNIKITAEDSSKEIDFNGSVYAPDAYIIIGGSIDPNDKNVINHNGVIIGSYIEIDGKNENKDYGQYLDKIYENSMKGIEIPVENPTEFNILNFKSYYIDY